MDGYKTIRKTAADTVTDRKSEFIGTIAPVQTEDEALAFITEIKKKYPDARHNVYAYILRENNTTRFSDDGEPHGTAGLPVLELLRKEGLTDVVIVVTRYFGGILLGTGGLVRAYTAAAKAAVEQAGIVVYRKFTMLAVKTAYPDYPKIDYYLQGCSVLHDQSDFDTDVTLSLAVPGNETDKIIKNIIEITAGKASVKILGERFDFIGN